MIDNNKMDSREELLFSMSEIDDRYIMEAEGKQHFRRSGFFADPRRRTFLKTAAAVLAFFILAVPVGKVIRSSMQDPGSQEYAKVTSAASNEGDMEMANGQDPQSGAGETGMGGPVAGGIYTSGGIPIAGQEKSGDQSAGTDNNKGLVLDQAVLEKVLGTELAGLRLGMTESEVLAIVGKPDSRSEYQGTKAGIQSSGDAGLNGFKTGSGASSSASAIAVHEMVTWFYDADQEERDLMTKMSLGMAYDHGEWILNSIHVYSPRYSLDNGIHPGSSLSDVEKACPDYVHTADAPVTDTYENEAPDMIRSETFTYGTRESGYEGTYIVIYLEDEIVSSVSMEYYFRDLASFDDEYSDEDSLYVLGSNHTVVWDTGNGKSSVLKPAQCKQIEVIANIEELEEGKPFEEAAFVIDFHNDTVMLLSGDGEQGAICTIRDRDAFEASLKAGGKASGASGSDELTAGLYGLDLIGYYNFPEGCLAAVEETLGEVSR